MGVGSVLLLFMFAFVYSKITLQSYKKVQIPPNTAIAFFHRPLNNFVIF